MRPQVIIYAGRRRVARRQNNNEPWINHKLTRALRKMKLVGLRQALQPGLSLIERLWWFGVFMTCLGLAIFLTADTLITYIDEPILNTYREDEPIYKFPFPAVSVTGTMILRNNANTELDDFLNYAFSYYTSSSPLKKFIVQGRIWTLRLVETLFLTIDHFCKFGTSFLSKAEIVDDATHNILDFSQNPGLVEVMNQTLYDSITNTELNQTVISYVKNKTLDCKNIFAACFWEGTKENCTQLFVSTQTDVGPGCTFNRVPETMLRRRQGLMSLLQDAELTQKELNQWSQFDLDSAISVEGIEDFHEFSRPRSQHQAGMMTGLSFMLIFDEDMNGTSCPIVDSFGYLIGIHSPFEVPRIMKTGVAVGPKTEAFIKVKTEAILADKKIRSLSINKRKCYFQSENPLENFQYYTLSNCHDECLGKEIQSKCNCTLLTLSTGNNEVLCGPLKHNCVTRATASFHQEGYDRKCRNPKCYSPCTEVKYLSDVSFLPYGKDKIFGFSSSPLLKEDTLTAIVHITHGSDSVSIRERKLQLLFSVVIGVIGGIWGMIFEISLFSLFTMLARLVHVFIKLYKGGDKHDTNSNPPLYHGSKSLLLDVNSILVSSNRDAAHIFEAKKHIVVLPGDSTEIILLNDSDSSSTDSVDFYDQNDFGVVSSEEERKDSTRDIPDTPADPAKETKRGEPRDNMMLWRRAAHTLQNRKKGFCEVVNEVLELKDMVASDISLATVNADTQV